MLLKAEVMRLCETTWDAYMSITTSSPLSEDCVTFIGGDGRYASRPFGFNAPNTCDAGSSHQVISSPLLSESNSNSVSPEN